MTQIDAYIFLRSNPNEWFTVREVSQIIGNTISNAGTNLKRLFETGFASRRIKEGGRYNIYEYKLR